jgi:hypothetical protein
MLSPATDCAAASGAGHNAAAAAKVATATNRVGFFIEIPPDCDLMIV